jgi:hypothetical protein
MNSPRFIPTLALVLLAATGAACAPARAADDPVAIVQAAYDRANNGDLDGFMAFIADDAVERDANGRFEGAEAIRNLWQGELAGQIRIELTDLNADGNVVTYTGKVYHGDRLVDTVQGVDVVAGGKIIFDGTADTYQSECESDASQAFCQPK